MNLVILLFAMFMFGLALIGLCYLFLKACEVI
jgi:hypothetical protein